jgi:hypothetical protein
MLRGTGGIESPATPGAARGHKLVEVAGFEPACPWPLHATSTCNSATLISPGPRRRTRLSPSQSPDRRYSARSADRSTRHACCRRQFQLAGVARPTWLSLGSQGHFFSFAVCCFAGGFTRGPRLSTGSGALQPRVESRTPPENRRAGRWFRPVGRSKDQAPDRVIRDQRTPAPCAPAPAWQARRRGLKAPRASSARNAPGATPCARACRRRV